MLISMLIMLIGRNLLERDTRTACLILMCETWKHLRILSRFQIWTQKYQIPDSKNLHFPSRVSGQGYEIGPVCLSVSSHGGTIWRTDPKFGGGSDLDYISEEIKGHGR